MCNADIFPTVAKNNRHNKYISGGWYPVYSPHLSPSSVLSGTFSLSSFCQKGDTYSKLFFSFRKEFCTISIMY